MTPAFSQVTGVGQVTTKLVETPFWMDGERMTRVHRGETGHRPTTAREKSEFYRHLGRLRVSLKEVMKPIYLAVGGRSFEVPRDPVNAVATVQAITIVMEVLEAMRVEAVYEAGELGVGYPDIGAATGISRQAARTQWPGAVSSPAHRSRRCPLSSYLRKAVAQSPGVECDARTPRAFIRVDYKLAPAGVEIPGCLAHAALYRELVGRSAVYVADSRQEARRMRELLTAADQADPLHRVLRAQARHGSVAAMRELAWRTEADGAEADTGWLQDAAVRGDRFAAREWARHLEQQGRLNETITLWRGPAAAGDRMACIELSNIYARYKRHDLAAAVWRPLAVEGDGFALRAFAEVLHAARRIDKAIPVFQRAYEHGRRKWGNTYWYDDEQRIIACHALIDLLIEDGRDHQALTWLRRVAKAEPTPKWALDELTWRLERAGQLDEAEGWLWHAVDLQAKGYRDPNPDVPNPSEKLYQFLLRIGRTSQAEALLRDPSARGLAAARRQAIRSLKAADQEAELAAWVNSILAEGQPEEFGEHAQELERAGKIAMAIAMWVAAAEQGDFHARWEAVRLMDANGQADEAETWLRDLIRAGQTAPADTVYFEDDPGRWHSQQNAKQRAELSMRQATRVLAALLKRHGRVEEALNLLRRTADQGDKYAAKDLREWMRKSR